MTDLRIRITESDGIAFAGLSDNRYPQAIYRGAKARNALDRIIDGLQDYARAEPAEMVDALHFCPEFCQLAAAVHGLHLAESDETPTTEAIAILTKLCDPRQPEAIRTRAGNLLIDIAEDDRAVCDASSVDEDHFQGCVAVNFPPSGCLACAFTSGCRDARGMMCTPSERKDSRRIVWVTP